MRRGGTDRTVLVLLLLLGTAVREDGPPSWASLESPYRNQRRRAEAELLARAQDAELTLADLLRSPEEPVRRAAASAATQDPSLATPDLLLDRMAAEPSSSVRLALLDALVAQGGAADPVYLLRATQPSSPGQRSERDRYLLGRSRDVFDSLIHDGTIPGFYDGQFAAIWQLDPRMPERLIQIARDDSYHFVLRILAVMALHESRRPTLREDLGPLILDTEFEFLVSRDEWVNPRRGTPEAIYRQQRVDLSRYVRFSLAKAGIVDPILEMIQRMDDELSRRQADMLSRGHGDFNRDIVREWLRSLLFETGYYFQQFDDYDRASERYLQLVEKFPESRSCVNAYYNLACISSIRGRKADCLRYLQKAIDLGFTDYEWLEEDGDLAPMREDPAFLRLVEQARTGVNLDQGTGWLSILVPELPPGRSLFQLPPARQAEVLSRVARRLTDAEVESLLGAAPAQDRPRLAGILLRERGEAVPDDG